MEVKHLQLSVREDASSPKGHSLKPLTSQDAVRVDTSIPIS